MRIFHRYLLFGLISSCFIHFSYGQHYLSAGVGITASPVSSPKMDTFLKTYNQTNRLVIVDKLDGFTFGMGIRYHIAYRYHNQWCGAFLAGYQDLNDFDIADFKDGSRRKLALDLKTYFLELELGHNWGSFFSNGLVCFYLDRNVQIKNSYKSNDPDFVSSFTGTFKAPTSYSIDIGIAIGILKSPFFMVLKVMYPLYTGGKNDILRDAGQVAALQKFPADYAAYTQSQDYPGVGSNIDGPKGILTFSYALEL